MNTHALNYVLDKLVEAGWAERAGSAIHDSKSLSFSVEWTEKGKQRMDAILILITELECGKGRLGHAEFEVLRSVLSQYMIRK